MQSKNALLSALRNGESLNISNLLCLTILLSIPAILAQLSTILMQYIDAAMVGSLGAQASASIGLVSTTVWIFHGLIVAASMGFSVLVAHRIGANTFDKARDIVRESITSVLIFSLILMVIGLLISSNLPRWLGGNEELYHDAYLYFLVFCFRIPLMQLRYHFSSVLRSSGNMKTPSFLNVAMCVLDVIFYIFFIFSTQNFLVLGFNIVIPGFGLGVFGAALATALAELIVAIYLIYYTIFKSKELRFSLDKDKTFRSYIPKLNNLKEVLYIAIPMGTENLVFCIAQVVSTIIVAPLGTVAIAANSFGIIVESLCYMPGYGIADAATTLVGQSLGAKRFDLTKRLAYMTVWFGSLVMTIASVIMFILAPLIMAIMTNDINVQELATKVLRIECFAEPMYAVSIVAYGIFVGAKDTLIPALMNLGSIWIVRITLALILAPIWGLTGVWIAMAIELCFRGLIFIFRLYNGAWLNNFIIKQDKLIKNKA